MIIELEPLKREENNKFILDNQEAFIYGALEGAIRGVKKKFVVWMNGSIN